MNTEITDTNDEPDGWIFYDGECALCLCWLHRTEHLLCHRRFKFAPLQAAWARKRLGLTDAAALTEMRLLLATGKIFGGADAVMEIARHIWWAWPIWMISKIPGVMLICRGIYRLIAKNRSCKDSACAVMKVTTTPEKRRKHPRKTTTFFEMP